jgi:hypothetical protein
MLYTIKINVECSDDLADAIESPELVFEGLVIDALIDVFEFIAVQEVRIDLSPLEEIHLTQNNN